jgi:tetratricopeptide (TPR) repeat protein
VAEHVATAAARSTAASIRRAALVAIGGASPETRLAVAGSHLRDSIRTIRQAAAWTLSPARNSFSTIDRQAFDAAAAEYVASQRYNGDRAASRLNLGAFYLQLGSIDSALVEYRTAARLAPRSAAPHVNLAVVLRQQGRLAEARIEAAQALRLEPDNAQAKALQRLLGTR